MIYKVPHVPDLHRWQSPVGLGVSRSRCRTVVLWSPLVADSAVVRRLDLLCPKGNAKDRLDTDATSRADGEALQQPIGSSHEGSCDPPTCVGCITRLCRFTCIQIVTL